MRKGKFITELVDSPMSDGQHWKLRQNLVWRWDDTGEEDITPRGFVTDFASVPDLSKFAGITAAVAFTLHWPYLFFPAILICIFAKWIDDDHLTDAPSCGHDKDYMERKKPRWKADYHFLCRMWGNDVNKFKAIIYYINLRLFGWTHWYFGHHLD